MNRNRRDTFPHLPPIVAITKEYSDSDVWTTVG